MTSGPHHSRKFNEEQVALILQRAGELQEQDEGENQKWLTLTQLQSIARESGLNDEVIQKAANEIAARPVDRSLRSPLLGGPRSIVLEATVPGEIDAGCYELLVDALRRETGELGQANVFGKTLSWATAYFSPGLLPYHRPSMRSVLFTASIRNQSTTLRIEESLGGLAGTLFGGLLGGIGGGGLGLVVAPLAAMGMPMLIPLGLVAWVGGTYALTRKIYRSRAKKRDIALHQLLSRLVQTTQDYIEERTLKSTGSGYR